jgi:hypothetical protein
MGAAAHLRPRSGRTTTAWGYTLCLSLSTPMASIRAQQGLGNEPRTTVPPARPSETIECADRLLAVEGFRLVLNRNLS